MISFEDFKRYILQYIYFTDEELHQIYDEEVNRAKEEQEEQ